MYNAKSIFIWTIVPLALLAGGLPFIILFENKNNNSNNDNEPFSVGTTIRSKCQPSPRNRSIHIVVGGYKYRELEGGVSFEKNNYLWDMGLTHTRIFWYRKTRPEKPERTLHGPCNVTMEERVFLPNYGQEAVAFIHHIVEVYDHNPPEAIMFLHGHLGRAWHTTCESIFSRMIGYYKYAMHTAVNHNNDSTLDAVIALTDINNLQNINKKNKKATPKQRRQEQREQQEQERKRRNTDSSTLPCELFLNRTLTKYNMSDPRLLKKKYNYPCCSNGVFPWSRIQRYPLDFYKDWLHIMSNTSYDYYTMSRFCFEYIIFPLYATYPEMKDHHRELVQKGWIQEYDTNATELTSCTRLPELFGLKTKIE